MDDVRAAFDEVPRERFLPKSQRRFASYDGPLPIGHDQTSSQPRTVEKMLRLLDVRRGQRVLDVGSGSGWTTALLAHLTGQEGSVLGVELEPDLVKFGSENLARTGLDWASIVAADPAVVGVPERGPFDRVLVSATAQRLPDELLDTLADPGRLVIPVRGEMVLVVRDGGRLKTSRHGSYRFVPLR
ncbi:MAG: protein-L-isoaspartate O-methyltransferase [Actinomycetota bacterium]|nr:protein-L-isoaspartate O-methyltransferase [Actinomycetota bacterium]